MTDIDWGTIEDWDRRYYLHNTASGRELNYAAVQRVDGNYICLLYTSPSPRDMRRSRMPSSA